MDQTVSPVFDVIVVGHFSIDSILLPKRQHSITVLGGSVTYVSLVSRRLEKTVSIISRVGGDFPEAYLWWLREEGIDLSGVVKTELEQTTRFELQYGSDLSERTLRLKSKAPAVSLTDISVSVSAKAIHLAPIAGEISYELTELLRNRAEILSLDIQGLLRKIDSDGNILLGPPADMRLLELVNVCKCSENEIKILTGRSDLASSIKAVHDCGVETVIVTKGAEGAVLSLEGTAYDVPACIPEKVIDPTGAGDVFIGGFLAELVQGHDPYWCACVGSGAASIVVESFGPTFFGEKEEIYRRAALVYNK